MNQVPKEDVTLWASCSKIWIVLHDGRQYQITNPELVGSTLSGHFRPDDHKEIDLADIESVSMKKMDKTRTFGLAAWGLVATAVIISILSDDDGSEPCPT